MNINIFPLKKYLQDMSNQNIKNNLYAARETTTYNLHINYRIHVHIYVYICIILIFTIIKYDYEGKLRTIP